MEVGKVVFLRGSRASVTHRPAHLDGYTTGALDIAVKDRRVLSIPSQLGCRIGCTFCVSRNTPLVRNLSVDEMLEMVHSCFEAEPPDGRAVELSFTGEGEPLLNWKNTTVCAREAARRYPGVITAIRYCFSGLGANQLLARAQNSELPVRLQFSLHAARQPVRSSLVPRSESLEVILAAIRAHEALFSAIELNVVLQDGVNDRDADLQALMNWGDPRWPVLLNPLLADGKEVVAANTSRFAAALCDAGREVKVYSQVGSLISRQGIYPLMSARVSAAGRAPALYASA
ncbi:radical SAM protein [Paraburkholderia sp. EG287A]|uniref:radical SAM protein n=1 Tax=Paraburkholderia sp. EG287A TaxID=3237012 RepID=UPI0034D3282D